MIGNPWKEIKINGKEILVLATAYDALKKLSSNSSDQKIYDALELLYSTKFIYKTLEELNSKNATKK